MANLSNSQVCWLANGTASVEFGGSDTIEISAAEMVEVANEVCPITPDEITYRILRLLHPDWERDRCKRTLAYNLQSIRKSAGWKEVNLIALYVAASKIPFRASP